MAEGRLPDYHVCVGRKGDKSKRTFVRRVGAAWVGQEKGQINLVFDCDVVISSKTAVVLFENKDGNGEAQAVQDEDVPF